MKYADLRDFLGQLESLGELKRIAVEVSPRLEMTEFCDRMLKNGGPAILFERPTGHSIPVLGNLFGTVRRVALHGAEDRRPARDRKTLAALREPEAPRGLREVWKDFPNCGKCFQVRTWRRRSCRPRPAEVVGKEGLDLYASCADVLASYLGPLSPGALRDARPLKPRQNSASTGKGHRPNRVICAARASWRRSDFRDPCTRIRRPRPLVALWLGPCDDPRRVTPVPDTCAVPCAGCCAALEPSS